MESNIYERIERGNKLLLRVVCIICVLTFTITVLMEPVMQAEAFALSTALAWAFLGVTSLVGVSGITYTSIQNQTSLTDHHFTFGNGNSGRLIDLQGQWYDNLTEAVKASVDKVVSILKNNNNKKIEVTAENKNDVAATIESVRQYWYDNFGVTDASQATSAAPVTSHVGLYEFDTSALSFDGIDLPDSIAMGNDVLNGVFFPTAHDTRGVHFIAATDGVLHPNVDLYSVPVTVANAYSDGSSVTFNDYGMYLSYCRSKKYQYAEFNFWETLGLNLYARVYFNYGNYNCDRICWYVNDQCFTYVEAPANQHFANIGFRVRLVEDPNSACERDYIMRIDAMGRDSSQASGTWAKFTNRNSGSIASSYIGLVCDCYTTHGDGTASSAVIRQSSGAFASFVDWVMQSWQSTNTADMIDGTSALAIENEDASAKILEFVPATPPEGDGDDDENPEIPVVWFPDLPKRKVNPADPDSETVTVTDPNQFVFNDFADVFTQEETIAGYPTSDGGSDEPDDLVTSLTPPATLGLESIWHYVADTFSYVNTFFDSLVAIYHYVPRPIMYLAWADVVLVIVFGVYKRLIA